MADMEKYRKWLADNPEQQDEGFSGMEMLGNVPSSAMQFAKDMAQPIMHPIDTATSLGNLAIGGAQKLIPGVQSKEKYADQLGEFISGRYGSMDDFLNTLEKDPIGILSDISLGVTGIGAGAKVAGLGGKLSSMGRAIDPLSMAMSAPGAAMKGAAAIKDPVGLYQSAAKFPTTLDIKKGSGTRDRLAQTALDVEAMPSPSGIARVEDAMGDLDTRIDAIIDLAGDNTLPASRAARHMDALRAEIDVPAIDASADLAKANKVAADLGEQLEKLGKTDLTAKEFQNMKRKAYKKANYDVKRMKDDPATNKARKTIARGAKEAVEELAPGVKELNEQYAKLIELMEPLQRASGRIGNRDMGGIGVPIKIGAGSAAGGPLGGIIGGLAGIADIPTIKAFSAIKLNKAKKRGLFEVMSRGPVNYGIQQGMYQSGRIDDQLSNE